MAGGTIGLIDDDYAVRRGLTRLLEACGYRVEPFDSADAFLLGGGVTLVDCVLLDLRLPGMTGLDLFDRLVLHGRQVPIIFITGHPDALMTGEAGRSAPAAVLVKPFDEHTLLTAIEAALAQGPGHAAPTLP